MNRHWTGEELDARSFTDACLSMAIMACGMSQWRSDRAFAEVCSAELERRLELERVPAEARHQGTWRTA